MIGRFALILTAFVTLTGAAPPRLISDIAPERIDIEYSFAGAELLIYGAIQYPGGRTPRTAPELAIVLRGPPEAITLRQKEKMLGIWVNRRAVRYETAPAFYSIATTAPIAELIDERTAAIYELGLSHLQLSPASTNPPEEIRLFEQGLLDMRRRAKLYQENPRGIEFTENILYRSRIPIPSDVPVGTYTAEIYLIRNGRIEASTSRDIAIDKSGFERSIYLAAQRHSALYGAAAVVLALVMGWAAGFVVRR